VQPGPAVAADGRRRAILVGVNQYDHPKLRPLRYSVNDVVALGPFLRQEGYEVTLLTDEEGRKQADRRPTLGNIRTRVRAAIKQSRRADTLLIAMAGHGLQFGGDRDSYFCPADGNPTDRASLLSLGRLLRDLDECGGTKLLLVDACRDDPAIGRGVGGGAALQLPDEVAALFSCAAGERALEEDRYAHGLFFYHVLQGLRGDAAGPDGEVTWLSLTDYVKKRVPADVARLHGGRVTQTPSLRTGELTAAPPVLARKASQGKATLAALYAAVELPVAAELKVAPTQPRVAFVVPGGGADRLGLRRGDVLLKVDGWDVVTVAEAQAALRNRPTGSRIELTVLRDGRNVDLAGPYETLLTDSQIMSRLRRLAEGGDAEAQYFLGFSHAAGRFTTRDESEAAGWFRKAADQGLAQAQYQLGVLYANGRGLAKDDAQAVAWYRKAADQGNAPAQYKLGSMYESGRGVARDDAQAVAWYRKAAEQGNAPAQYKLGVLYANGRGLAKDDAQAVAWYRKAADQGNAPAQCNLGWMYESGRGVARDDAQAVAWYRKAAEQGNAPAQYKLGSMYEFGRGVGRDHARAVAWYRKAAGKGNRQATEKLRRLGVNV
jgi:TPR repeat protein